MTKVIGRKYGVGFGKESTRGTAVSATFWLPKTDVSYDDKINYTVNDSSINVIEDSIGQDITSKVASGSISGVVYDKSIGILLVAVMGQDSAAQVGGDTTVYDHTFTVLESAQHPALTMSVTDANSPTSGAGLVYTLCSVDQIQFDFETGKYLTYKVDLKSNSNTAQAVTASFVTENLFRPQDGEVKLASTLAGISGASAISVKKGTITIKKNIDEDIVVGSVNASDRLNKEFVVEGSLELTYNDRVFQDTDMLADLVQALQVKFSNTGTTIGTTSNPTITFKFAKVKVQEVARKISNKDIIYQTVKFKAFYSISDTSMLSIVLRNLQATAY